MIDYKDKDLIGSSILFSSNSIVGKLIKLGGFFDRINGFKPNEWSHIGTIVMQNNGKLGIIEALKPKVIINDLENRIKTCNDKMLLAKLNDESLKKIKNNNDIFKSNIKIYKGINYSTFNAILSGIDILPDNSWLSRFFTKKRNTLHCSFLDGKLKQSVGIIDKNIDCKELTPQDCYEMDIYSEKIIIKDIK